LQVLETAAQRTVGAGGGKGQRQGRVAAHDMGCPRAQSNDTAPCVGVAMKSAHSMLLLLQPQRSQDSLLQRGTVLKPLLLACALLQLLTLLGCCQVAGVEDLASF
jgi:hypothetical protein